MRECDNSGFHRKNTSNSAFQFEVAAPSPVARFITLSEISVSTVKRIRGISKFIRIKVNGTVTICLSLTSYWVKICEVMDLNSSNNCGFAELRQGLV